MTHKKVLVEEDHVLNIRWITANGRHIPFWNATKPLPGRGNDVTEETPPDDSRWLDYIENSKGYADFKQRQGEK